ncbi:hypothetical protein ACFL1S_06535 [Pseudomonadota bacterium]
MTARISSVFFSIILLVSCAHQQPADTVDTGAIPAPVVQVGQAGNYWWYARFKMAWGDQRRADFSQNLIVAHEVVAPLLVRYSDEIELWRFHRRASTDEAGHQFSFIFYATPDAAHSIFEDIGTTPVVEGLLDSGDLLKLLLDDPARPRRASIAGTSDPNWPESIQNSWPYFIMGVSLMWLDLLEQLVDPDEIASQPDISLRLDYYREVSEELTTLWKRVGRHALFHHINAIYGYEPLELVF